MVDRENVTVVSVPKSARRVGVPLSPELLTASAAALEVARREQADQRAWHIAVTLPTSRGFEAYAASDAVNWSKLKYMGESPAHYIAAQQSPDKSTAAKAMGSLYHCLTLEPHTYADRYAIAPEVDRRTKAGKEEYTAFLDRIGGRTAVKADDVAHAKAMADATRAHPELAPLIDGSICEVPLWWFEVVDGVPVLCKGLIDWYHIPTGTLVDPKSAISNTHHRFSGVAAKLGYFGQAAHYKAGAGACGMPVDRVLFPAVEKVPPYDVVPYEMTAGGGLYVGEEMRMRYLRQFVECTRSGVWPGRSSVAVPLRVPEYIDPDYGLDLDIHTGDN